jgi:hypothetical protein
MEDKRESDLATCKICELTETELDDVSGGSWGAAAFGAIMGFVEAGPVGAVVGAVAGAVLD